MKKLFGGFRSSSRSKAANASDSTPQKPTRLFPLYAHMSGAVLPLSEVPDKAFAEGILGKGGAIEPDEGKLYAPADGIVETLFQNMHAVNLRTENGCELMLHIGVDTVKPESKYFTSHIAEGQHVKKGDLMISFDKEAMEAAGYRMITPLTVTNSDECVLVTLQANGNVRAGDEFLWVEK